MDRGLAGGAYIEDKGGKGSIDCLQDTGCFGTLSVCLQRGTDCFAEATYLILRICVAKV